MRGRHPRGPSVGWAVVSALLVSCSAPKSEPVVAPPPPASTAASAPTKAPEPSLDSKESRAVARTLQRVSKIRGIRASRPVPGVKLERDQLVGRVKDKALREYPAEALRREGQLLQLFGFAPPSFDYMSEMMTLLEAQLEGFYEPKNGTMYLAADLKGKEAQATLAHELVHALQDQNWDLKSRSSYRPGKGDETLALACLAEGDATSLMMDFIMADQNRTALDLPEKMMRELMANGVNGNATKSVPHILRTSLVAPYLDGLSFVHALRKRGGWSEVDRAWAQPPVTTEQILHVEKWDAREPAITVHAPPGQTLGAGWKLEDEDTFGELGFALSFEEWMPETEARSAAANWGGDRSAIYTRGDEIAFAVRARYDDTSDVKAKNARRFEHSKNALSKLSNGMKRHLGKAAIDAPDVICFERAELGPLLVARKDLEIVLIAGPARTTRAGAAGTWASASTCTQAKTWSEEIFAAK